MRILVTRPREDAADLIARLQAAGHQPVAAPLMTVVLEPEPRIDLAGVQAIVVTSRNALRAIAGQPVIEAARQLPMLAVGRATDAMARAMGFADVRHGPGTGHGLASLIRDSLDPRQGALLHLSGATIAFDLAAALAPDGFEVRRQIVYRTVAVDGLPARIAAELSSGGVEGVMLMSPRTAEIYSTLIAAAGLAEPARRITHFCLSEAVARRLAPLAPERLKIAVQPTTEEMLALIG